MRRRRGVAWQRSYSHPRPLIRRSYTHLVLRDTRTVCGLEIPREDDDVVLVPEGTGLCRNCLRGLKSRGVDTNIYLTAEEYARQNIYPPLLVEVDPARYTEFRQDMSKLKSLATSDFGVSVEEATAWARDAIDRGINHALATFEELGDIESLRQLALEEFECSVEQARAWATARVGETGPTI